MRMLRSRLAKKQQARVKQAAARCCARGGVYLSGIA